VVTVQQGGELLWATIIPAICARPRMRSGSGRGGNHWPDHWRDDASVGTAQDNLKSINLKTIY